MKTKTKELFSRIKKTIYMPQMLLLPGQLAFFLVLAIIPTMTLITYGASVLNLSTDFLYDFLQKAFSSEIAGLLLSSSAVNNAGLKLTIVILICYYISSNGMNSIIVTSNTIYGIKNGNWFQRRLKAIVMSIIFVTIVLFILLVPIFGDHIIYLIESVNLNPSITNIIIRIYQYLQSPIVWIILFLFIKIIYILAPDRKIKSHNANYGAIFTTVAWILISTLYSFYINNLANYTAFYGNLTSICVLMIWIYLLTYSFVIGMSLNNLKEVDELVKTGVIKRK